MTQRLIFVSPRFLFPTDSGGKIRTTQTLRGMKGGRFHIELVMPASESQQSEFANELESICDVLRPWDSVEHGKLTKSLRRAMALLHRYPVPVATDIETAGAAAVRSALDDDADLIIYDFPHAMVHAAESPVPSIVFTHNVEAEIFKRHADVARGPLLRAIWRQQYRKMVRFEKDVLNAVDGVIAVSERDADFFRDEWQVEYSAAIPTGVDTEFFSHESPSNDKQIVFCGSMDWIANVDGLEWYFDEVWPLVRQQEPDARMKVVGRHPPASLVRRVTSKAPEWEFTGFVDDVRDHVPGSAAFVIPLRVGGGTRIKAFEAMAMGCPVVSTSVGMEGLPVTSGEDFLVGDDAESFANGVVTLIRDKALRNRISARARELVESRFSFRNAAKVFEDICADVVERTKLPSAPEQHADA